MKKYLYIGSIVILNLGWAILYLLERRNRKVWQDLAKIQDDIIKRWIKKD